MTVVRALRPAPAPVVALAILLVLGMSGQANEKPTAEYRAAMKDLDAASQIMRHHARMVEPGGDFGYDWIESDSAKLKGAFEKTLAFWTARDVKRAMRLAQDAVSDAVVLERAAKRKHYDGVVAGVAGVLADCEPCHNAYREQLPDGSFEIR
jgi:cytochrome c556